MAIKWDDSLWTLSTSIPNFPSYVIPSLFCLYRLEFLFFKKKKKMVAWEHDNGGGESSYTTGFLNEPAGNGYQTESSIVKKEPDEEMSLFDDMINGVGDWNNEWPSASLSNVLPKPMEGLNDLGPPPFLRKTFEMVEDLKTDPIVSWSSDRNSFVVWDCHRFSENILPKYFKHENFSSFVRQLNTYVSIFIFTTFPP